MRSEADSPDGFSKPENLVIGPLVLVTGATYTPPSAARKFGGNKSPLLVPNGHRVTIELPRATRRVAGLAYARLPEGEVRRATRTRA
jgi:hypothetical protein